MELIFAILTALFVTAISLLAWHCGKLKSQIGYLRYQLIIAKAELFMERADEATRNGLGEDFTEEGEWPSELYES